LTVQTKLFLDLYLTKFFKYFNKILLSKFSRQGDEKPKFRIWHAICCKI